MEMKQLTGGSGGLHGGSVAFVATSGIGKGGGKEGKRKNLSQEHLHGVQ